MSEPSEAARAAAERAVTRILDRMEDKNIWIAPTQHDRQATADYMIGQIIDEIQSAIDASRPKWSAEKPTKAGWYFLKYPSGRSTVGTVDEYMDFYAYGTCWSVAHMPGQWAGPLAEPEETK